MQKLIQITDGMMDRLRQVQEDVALMTGIVPDIEEVIYNMIISGLNDFEGKYIENDN